MLKTIKQALFSTGLEMPKWTALPNQAPDYEIRQYEPAKWVCTSVKTVEWDSAINTGFMKLFNYIKGKNEKAQHQANPPKPTEPDVFIENRPAITVFVRSFGGFAKAKKNQEEILALAESLKRDGKAFQERVYYSAGYDSPFKLLNRHNEVWLIKRS
ncbi:heme-binding protein 2 isoform X2 [Hemicordylus capensis]|uniref:heme-binding protein 2 isoform X2 n=1 Tax=Hemicordylus capensis TaxID=884348 RepID=UPI0023023EE6|nr:heme-binding protein 2 isoform X2 [Hemicordylus capensis]